jgi:AcrR family transcriptional regulator
MTFSTASPHRDDPAPAEPDEGGAVRPRDVGRTERLVAAARDLANRTGSAAFRVADVTEGAGLSLKSFYRCFPGKDDLLLALLEDDSRLGAALVRDRVGERTGAEAARAYVHALLALAATPGAEGYAGVLVREHRRLSEHRPDELRESLAPLVDLLAGFVPGTEPRRAAETMFSVLLLGIHEIVLGRVDDVDELAEYLFRFCWRGLEG